MLVPWGSWDFLFLMIFFDEFFWRIVFDEFFFDDFFDDFFEEFFWRTFLVNFIFFYPQNGICAQKYPFGPKNDGEKWARKNYFEIPPYGKMVIFEVRENKLQFEIWNSKNRFLAELKIQDIIWLPDTLEYSPILPLSLRWIFALFLFLLHKDLGFAKKHKYILVHG